MRNTPLFYLNYFHCKNYFMFHVFEIVKHDYPLKNGNHEELGYQTYRDSMARLFALKNTVENILSELSRKC